MKNTIKTLLPISLEWISKLPSLGLGEEMCNDPKECLRRSLGLHMCRKEIVISGSKTDNRRSKQFIFIPVITLVE